MADFRVGLAVDAADLIALREELRGPRSGQIPSVLDFVVRAAALALRRHPALNATCVDGALDPSERVNILVDDVFVVHDADIRSLGTIAAEVRELLDAAREDRLPKENTTGATFAVAGVDVAHFTAGRTAPQAAVFGVGAVEEVPVVVDGLVRPGRRLPLSPTCAGTVKNADGAAFLATVRELLHQPRRLLL